MNRFWKLTGLFVSATVLSLSAQGQHNLDSLAKKVEKQEKEIEWLKNLKVTGWVQAQFQMAESKGAKNFDGGDFLENSNNRFMIRRGRVKFTYNQKYSQYVLQLNATERGVNLVEIFAKVTDPWTKSLSLTAGVQNRPFGFEIQQSSAFRETPERSRFVQLLLPNERDLGAMLTYQPVKGKKLYGLKIDGGFFNGVGIAVPSPTNFGTGVVDFDSYKDFIGRAYYARSFKEEKYSLGIGVSHYNGGFVSQNNRRYADFTTNAAGMKTWMVSDTLNGTKFTGSKAPRVYVGGELQFSVKTLLGTTTIRGEYVSGTQSGTKGSTRSASTLPASPDVYVRSFDAGYAYFIQRIGKSKHEIALKYEWYDPNSNLSSADFGAGTEFKDSELKYQMLGIGYNYYWDDHVKLMVYYSRVENEKGAGITGFDKDLKDDIFTIRVQYRF